MGESVSGLRIGGDYGDLMSESLAGTCIFLLEHGSNMTHGLGAVDGSCRRKKSQSTIRLVRLH